MTSFAQSIAVFDARQMLHCRHYGRLSQTLRKLSGQTLAVAAKLRQLAPYAAIELVLPGGSLMAVLLWLYRRQKTRRADGFARLTKQEML